MKQTIEMILKTLTLQMLIEDNTDPILLRIISDLREYLQIKEKI